jgi:hypothetical protein
LTASARAGAKWRVGTKKRAFRSNKETDEGKKMRGLLKLLDQKSPIQAPYKETAMGERAGGSGAMGI